MTAEETYGCYEQPCGHWSTVAGRCGRTPTRHYLTGYRCRDHTPAALAGEPEPGHGSPVQPRAGPGEPSDSGGLIESAESGCM